MKYILAILLSISFVQAKCQSIKATMLYTETTLEGEKTEIEEPFDTKSTWLNGCSYFHFKKIRIEGIDKDSEIILKIAGKVAYRKKSDTERIFVIDKKDVDPIQNLCKIFVVKNGKIIFYHEIGISGCN